MENGDLIELRIGPKYWLACGRRAKLKSGCHEQRPPPAMRIALRTAKER
jgi:hypothetical protein